MQAHYRDYGKMEYARSVFVIHNIAHQGRGPMSEVGQLELGGAYPELFRLDDPVGGEHMNIMKVSKQFLWIQSLALYSPELSLKLLSVSP